MKFIDEVVIAVQAGNGGRGCVSFRREKFIPKGGPDGGDGGKGGDILFKTTSRIRTLHQFQFKKKFQAQNGRPGQGKRKTGKNGQDIVLYIPPGTVITYADSGRILKDFTRSGQQVVAAGGGMGGQGNARFKSAVNRSPRFAQPGTAGEAFELKLDLKLIADAGIIGLPNAGKSTLITAVSSAHPKIGSYPFTTLSPNLAVVRTEQGEPFIAADIPGLIEGAHKGVGLGVRFLKHIERTRILIHLIDASTIDPDHPLETFHTINRELEMYGRDLIKKPQIVVLNKIDIAGAEEKADLFQKAFHQAVLTVSALEGKGTDRIISKAVQLLDETDDDQPTLF